MGTTYSIRIVDRIKSDRLIIIKGVVDKKLIEINQSMSTYIPNSELSRLNKLKANQNFILSKGLSKVMRKAWDIAKLTNGAFDPTVGALVNRWGFGPNARANPPSESEVKVLRERVGYKKLIWLDEKTVKKVIRDLYIDLSAIAKGYGVDEVSDLLWSMGLKHTMVEIGGEIKTRGLNQKGQNWRLGIESPFKDKGILRVAKLSNMSIASSGNYRNFYQIDGEVYSHTIDPRTGYPVKGAVLASSTISHSCMEADAWATALMVLGQSGLELAQNRGVASLVINRVKKSTKINMSSRMEIFLSP